jgi:hypothetical protein
MHETHSISTPSRRGFLRRVLISVGGACGWLAVRRPALAAPETGEPRPAESAGRGYRETAHVRAYYESARF